MSTVDGTTWQALGLVLTLIGLVVSVLLWKRRGPASGLRGVAWSLLPLAAALTGLLRLLWDIADSVLGWAARLVFSPVVWLGLILAGLSAVLFVVSGFLRRRSGGAPRPVTRKPANGKALTDQGPAPASTSGSTKAGTDDMADIEEILRKHGIT